MHKSLTKRRTLGVLGVVLATQLLSACIVLPVPSRRGVVVVQPDHGHGHHGGHGHGRSHGRR